MTRMRQSVGLLIAAALLSSAGAAAARPATVSDFAICNRDADRQAGTPAASPLSPEPRPQPGERLPAVPREGTESEPLTPGPAPDPGPVFRGGTDPTGTMVVTDDPLLAGMAAARADDPAYAAAYRQCMARRGITGG